MMIKFNPINFYNSAKQNCRRSINKLLGTPIKQDYILLSKNDKVPLTQFPASSWAIQPNAVSFTVVRIGKKSNPDYMKEITTFYDIQNRPLAKCFWGTDIDYKMRTYKYDIENTSANMPASIRSIATEECRKEKHQAPIGKDLKFISAFGKWIKKSAETQYVTDIGDAKKLSIMKVRYNNKSRDITLTEYPLNMNKESSDNKKVLNLTIGNDSHKYYVKKLCHSSNVSTIQNDEYFPYRFLSDEEKCKELSYYFLRKKGLDNLGLNVEIPSRKVGPDAAAHFSSQDSAIRWRDVPEYKPIVMVAAHEVEHAAQHSLIGRLTGGESAYEIKCRAKFGKIKDKDERLEAIRCFEAQRSYPVGFESDYAKKHDENYLEIKANDAGFEAYKEYSKGQKALKQIFPYFADTKNMF